MVRPGTPARIAVMVPGHKTTWAFDRYNIANYTNLGLAGQNQETYLRTYAGTTHQTDAKKAVDCDA
ncbi:MAG TPA: hypothetical protein EYP19_12885 [Desulfobacterales bacterium]|nr:hypothetical protein [Desulfobacterales bacterium]